MVSIKRIIFALVMFGNLAFCSGFDPDMTMTEWIQRCKSLPKNRIASGCRGSGQIRIEDSAFGEDKVLAWKAFRSAMQQTIALLVDQLSKSKSLGAAPACAQKSWWKSSSINFNRPFAFQPFAQKLDLQPGSELIFHGDFHGDCHSLMLELETLQQEDYLDDQFKIIKPNVSMVFLGDYVDRGLHGAEVMFTLFRLKLANPDRLFIVRGNHEDLKTASRYGFLDECLVKFSEKKGQRFLKTDFQQIGNLYDVMPVVLYVGCGDNYLQCCHGGMEPGYNPSKLLNDQRGAQFELLGTLKRSKFVDVKRAYEHTNEHGQGDARKSKHFHDFVPTAPDFTQVSDTIAPALGFMWHDFDPNNTQNNYISANLRGLVFSKLATEELLDFQNQESKKQVRGVFRAHQHSRPMIDYIIASKGLFDAWKPTNTSLERTLSDRSVWTFNVAPDTVYGSDFNFDFYAYAYLTVAESYDDWRLRVVNLTDSSPAPSHGGEGGGAAADGGRSSGGGGGSKEELIVPSGQAVQSAAVTPIGGGGVSQETSISVGSRQSTQSSARTPDNQLVEQPLVPNDNRWLLTRLIYWLLSRPKVFIYWLLSFISR